MMLHIQALNIQTNPYSSLGRHILYLLYVHTSHLSLLISPEGSKKGVNRCRLRVFYLQSLNLPMTRSH